MMTAKTTNVAKSCHGLFTFSGLLVAFTASWILLQQVDFAYSWFYDLLKIEQHIAQYGPTNSTHPGLQNAEKSEHVRLFSAINQAIHHQGKGLAFIEYHDHNGHSLGLMLHQAEITHLKDVAELIDRIKPIALLGSGFWLLLFGLIISCRITKPSLAAQGKWVLGLVLLLLLPTLMLGPEQFFYHLHEWVFPPDHQWFFYYQASLMSMLMKAPDLFAAIAVIWFIGAMLVFLLCNVLLPQLFSHKRLDRKHK